MKEKALELSALLDAELEAHEAAPVFAGLRQDAQLRAAWSEYRLIGEALRGEPDLHADITARVMAGVRQQPVVLAPVRRVTRPLQTALALAASLAGVAVVGWLAFAPAPEGPMQMAKVSPASTAPVARAATRDMREYLLAHHAQVSPLLPQGGTQHIRSIAAHPVARGH